MNRRIQLSVSADIDLQLDLSPRRLWFGRLVNTEPVTLSATINGTKIDTVTIESIGIRNSVSKDAFTWVLSDERQKGNNIRLDVTVHPDKLVSGKFNYPLVLETNLDSTKKIILNLSGDVVGLLSATPQRILFGNYETNVPMEESVTLAVSDSQIPFKVVSVESGDPEVTVTVVEPEPGIQRQLLVRFEPTVDRPRFQTQVKVTTDLKSQSEILLDVHGFKKREVKKMTPRAIY